MGGIAVCQLRPDLKRNDTDKTARKPLKF